MWSKIINKIFNELFLGRYADLTADWFNKHLTDGCGVIAHEMKPGGSYIIRIPSDVDIQEFHAAWGNLFRSSVNVMIVQGDVKIFEIGEKSGD